MHETSNEPAPSDSESLPKPERTNRFANLKQKREDRYRRRLLLLSAIKTQHAALSALLAKMVQWPYEDGVYRFYHQSFKVYDMQKDTEAAVAIFKTIAQACECELDAFFVQIVAEGTGKEFELSHNDNWLMHSRPIVEAFLHAKYFLEMLVRYGHEWDESPTWLPSGWAAVLYLFQLR